MLKKNSYNVGIVGATGNVGGTILGLLKDRNFPISKIYPIASSKSVGKEVSFGDDKLDVISIEDFDFNKVDLAFFCAGSLISQKYIPIAIQTGSIAIDKSSFYRLHEDIPLLVPEINFPKSCNSRIIANPNCCAIPLALVLHPLLKFGIRRIVVSTYQSVSGAGKNGIDELRNQIDTKQSKSNVFAKHIAFNVLPHIGNFNDDGSTEEEQKISLELQKILNIPIKFSVTCVRVPVFVGHSASVNIEFEESVTNIDIVQVLDQCSGIKVLYDHQYATALDVVGTDLVYVSRIRNDIIPSPRLNQTNGFESEAAQTYMKYVRKAESRKICLDHLKMGLGITTSNVINMWICSDNLRKGAALNAIQIAEKLL